MELAGEDPWDLSLPAALRTRTNKTALVLEDADTPKAQAGMLGKIEAHHQLISYSECCQDDSILLPETLVYADVLRSDQDQPCDVDGNSEEATTVAPLDKHFMGMTSTDSTAVPSADMEAEHLLRGVPPIRTASVDTKGLRHRVPSMRLAASHQLTHTASTSALPAAGLASSSPCIAPQHASMDVWGSTSSCSSHICDGDLLHLMASSQHNNLSSGLVLDETATPAPVRMSHGGAAEHMLHANLRQHSSDLTQSMHAWSSDLSSQHTHIHSSPASQTCAMVPVGCDLLQQQQQQQQQPPLAHRTHLMSPQSASRHEPVSSSDDSVAVAAAAAVAADMPRSSPSHSNTTDSIDTHAGREWQPERELDDDDEPYEQEEYEELSCDEDVPAPRSAKRQRASAGAKGPKKKPRQPPKMSNLKGLVCRNCGSNQTPQWRRGPEGPRTLCNACGVRYYKGLPLPPANPVLLAQAQAAALAQMQGLQAQLM